MPAAVRQHPAPGQKAHHARQHNRPATRPHAKQVREAARLISNAKRPVLYVGGGVLKARATDERRDLAELTGIPVVTTLRARGDFPASEPKQRGMPGMHG